MREETKIAIWAVIILVLTLILTVVGPVMGWWAGGDFLGDDCPYPRC